MSPTWGNSGVCGEKDWIWGSRPDPQQNCSYDPITLFSMAMAIRWVSDRAVRFPRFPPDLLPTCLWEGGCGDPNPGGDSVPRHLITNHRAFDTVCDTVNSSVGKGSNLQSPLCVSVSVSGKWVQVIYSFTYVTIYVVIYSLLYKLYKLYETIYNYINYVKLYITM